MPGTLRTGSRGCCTIEDSMDAQRAANKLGIPYYVWDFSEKFKEEVVDDFIAEYQAGRTPNPCMRCNERIKFAALLEKALSLGFDAVCTGHYATILTGEDGELELHRSNAYAKDQSYVLGVLTAEELKHAYFPIGASASKDDIRKEAAERGLSLANKPDSYDICFIPEGDTQDWLNDKLGSTPGEIIDRTGNVLGQHPGSHGYTVGQRKGLNIGKPAADGKPRFVLEIRPITNQVVVGPHDALAVTELAGSRLSWCGSAPKNQSDWFAAEVQVRAHADPVPCQAAVVGDELVMRLNEPLMGVAPGQTAVLYVGTRVLGQTTIDRTVSAVPIEA
jgi:tRNA-specific 2-thiouridylase